MNTCLRCLVMTADVGGPLTRCQAGTVLPRAADFFTPQPFVIAASRLVQPLAGAPAAVTVIDREMIEASGFTEIVDLLRLAPGFQVGLSTANSTTATTHHGQSDYFPRRMEVLVDGRSVYRTMHSVDWHDLGLGDSLDSQLGFRAETVGREGDDFVHDLGARAFANAAYHLADGRILNAGGMLEQGGLLDKAFSYRLALNHTLSPNHALRAGVTRYFLRASARFR